MDNVSMFTNYIHQMIKNQMHSFILNNIKKYSLVHNTVLVMQEFQCQLLSSKGSIFLIRSYNKNTWKL